MLFYSFWHGPAKEVEQGIHSCMRCLQLREFPKLLFCDGDAPTTKTTAENTAGSSFFTESLRVVPVFSMFTSWRKSLKSAVSAQRNVAFRGELISLYWRVFSVLSFIWANGLLCVTAELYRSEHEICGGEQDASGLTLIPQKAHASTRAHSDW